MPTDTESAALERLRAPETIRERAENVFHAAEQDRLEHFALDLAALDGVTERVLSVIERNYPDRAIPYHSRWGIFAPTARTAWPASSRSWRDSTLGSGRARCSIWWW